MTRRDTLYTGLEAGPGSFRFDERVVDVFPDMINRSVPGYSLVVPMIGQLARRFVQPGTSVHDLGCSLGAVSFAVRRALVGREGLDGVRIVATDSSSAMTDRLRERLGTDSADGGVPVDVVTGDIRDTDLSGSSFVALNFTLQFLDLDERDRLLARIADGLQPGGALVLAEKIRFEDAEVQLRQTEWHEDFKRLQGYSDLEIARKRSALEEVLKSETETRHLERLHAAGFTCATRWFQCFAFTAWLAEK